MGASNVKWVRLGDYIEQCDERLCECQLSCSPAYTTFVINDDKKVLPEYFFMYFNRAESDRYGWFISDSSVRVNLDWPRFLDIEIPLPSPDEQQKMVNVWKAFRKIKEQNEAKATPLMQVCQSYIQELKHKYPMQEIGSDIEEYDARNLNEVYKLDDVRGISIEKKIIETKANMDGVKLSPYKIFNPNTFCYVTITGNFPHRSQSGRRIAYPDAKCHLILHERLEKP